MAILVVDLGGTNVKMLLEGQAEPRRVESDKKLTPSKFLKLVNEACQDWDYDRVSLGYPGEVAHGKMVADPGNLGQGWVDFDLDAAFGKPVRVMNDAAMQALGAYDGGRMLFLGLGTGLGSTLIADRVILSLELGRLKFGGTDLGRRLGRQSFERDPKKWQADVATIASELRDALMADYVVLGGGNAVEVDPLPNHCRRGGNNDAFLGGFKLWDDTVRDSSPYASAWTVVR